MTQEQIDDEILKIKDLITTHFTQSNWIELGLLTHCSNIIDEHERLLQSLRFRDEDYEGNIITVLEGIIKKDNDNIQKIKNYISKKYPIAGELISTVQYEFPQKTIIFSPDVFTIPNKEQIDNLISVVFPFELMETFNSIKSTCDSLSLDCKKADEILGNSTFIQNIFELIYISKVVIVDLSDSDDAINQNVFYELGIAHTLGKKVILIAQSLKNIPSDLRHHHIIIYERTKEGYIKLESELKKRLEILFPSLFHFF
jgi:AbiJ N-terminal domain 5